LVSLIPLSLAYAALRYANIGGFSGMGAGYYCLLQRVNSSTPSFLTEIVSPQFVSLPLTTFYPLRLTARI
jgi:hypothetical protein